MIYRPQFAYPTPQSCKDEDFVYSFDGSNTPLLNQSVSALSVPFIPLVLDQDAPFYWRGVKVDIRTTSALAPNVNVKLRDCYLNDLSDGFIPATQFGFPQNPVVFQGANYTGPPVPFEPEIYCPRGGVIQLFIQAPTLAADTFLSVSMFGVKRFQGCV